MEQVLLNAAKSCYDAGLTPLPSNRVDKHPTTSWKKFQDERPTTLDIQSWFSRDNTTGIGLVTGSGLEVIDFDMRGTLYEPYKEIILEHSTELWNRLVIERTPSGGYHIFYRCEGVKAPNLKLAMDSIPVDCAGSHELFGKNEIAREFQGKYHCVLTGIENRGAGGFIQCAPTPGYEIIQGSFENIPIITAEERDFLISAARSFNRWVEPSKVQDAPQFEKGAGLWPGEDYKLRGNIGSLLKKHGAVELQNGRWRRPGKDYGTSGSLLNNGQVFYCFSSNWPPFEPGTAYSKFAVYTLLEHDGDFKAAAAQLALEGFGDQEGREVKVIDLNDYINSMNAKDKSDDNEELQKALTELNQKHAILFSGGRTLILTEVIDPILSRPDITLSEARDFKLRYLNRTFPVQSGKKKTKYIDLGSAYLEWAKRREFRNIVFDPTGEVSPDVYNLWRGLSIKPAQGSWERMKEHIFLVICSGNTETFEYVLNWLARLFQFPGGVRPGVVLALLGPLGCGKGIFVNNVGQFLGSHYLPLTSSSAVTSRFNGFLKNALLVFCDEAFFNGDKRAEGQIKTMITEPVITVEQKFVNPYTVKNHTNYIFASNGNFAVPAAPGERRFCCLDVSDKYIGNTKYFADLQKEMDGGGRAAMLFDLLNRDISGVDLRKFPKRPALWSQIVQNMHSVHQFWYECLRDACIGSVGAYSSQTGYGCWPDDGDALMEIDCHLLYQIFTQFDELNRNRPRDNIFGKELKKVCPGIVRKQHTNGARYYSIPPLAECRKTFEDFVKMPVNWDE